MCLYYFNLNANVLVCHILFEIILKCNVQKISYLAMNELHASFLMSSEINE